MNLRDNILIRPKALSESELRSIRDYISRATMTDSLVSNFEDDAPQDSVEWTINKNVRDTQDVLLTNEMRDRLDAVVTTHARAFIDSYYDIAIRDWEPLQLLHYGAGGHYIPHVDAETLYKDERGLDWWEKTLDRDVSYVCFLNDEFEGGELRFPDFDLTIKPRAGTLVCFPSDHNYIHGVNAVTKGSRYTLVTWMRVEGMTPVEEINRLSMEEYRRVWPKQLTQPPRLKKGGVE